MSQNDQSLDNPQPEKVLKHIQLLSSTISAQKMPKWARMTGNEAIFNLKSTAKVTSS